MPSIASRLVVCTTLFLSISSIHRGSCATEVPARASAAAALTIPSSQEMVGALNSVFGAHAHARANHANGALFDAIFIPSAEATGVSRAVHFNLPQTRVLVRFSNFGGLPDIADGDAAAAPYGMSLKFYLPGGQETDLVMHSFNGFPSATTADFVEFIHAMAASSADASRPNALERYADAHPAAKAFLAAPKPAPLNFATEPYFGVNTFKFTNTAGNVSFGRYRIEPLEPSIFLTPTQAATAAPDYLRVALRERLRRQAVVMLLQLQIAESGDALEDPSIAWPDSRRVVTLGRLTLTSPRGLGTAEERALVFFPDELPEGIEANDPMLKARTRAYAESLERRR